MPGTPRTWDVGLIATKVIMDVEVRDWLLAIDELLDIVAATVHTDGGVMLGGGANLPFKILAVLADGRIHVGDGATDPVAFHLLTNSTGVVRTEAGGLEVDTTGVATGGVMRGTGSGSWGILARGTALQALQVNSGGTDIEWASPTADVSKSAISFANIRLFGH